MTEIYDFLFFISLGIAARFLYIGATALARRTNLLPVTVILDALTALAVGGACISYVILTSAVVAPYMFAALLAGYLVTYWATKRVAFAAAKKPQRSSADKKTSDRNAAPQK